jgi:hypothetical protein
LNRRLPAAARCAAALSAALFATARAARAETLYVAPDGSDRWAGTLARANAARTNGPLATLVGARDTIRARKARGPLTTPVRVVVEAGSYSMRAPLILDDRDSGTASAPISYEAAPTAHPCFSGGRAITGWRAGTDGVWTAHIPDVAAGKWYFEQLWVNGRRAQRARTPNQFTLYAVGKARPADDPAHGDPGSVNTRAFRANPADIAALRELSVLALKDVTLTAYFSWETARMHVAAVDPKTGTIAVAGGVRWGFFEFGPYQRYTLENYRAALDAPGEWFLDRDGTLFYRPMSGEDPRRAAVVAPVVSTFLELRGDPLADRFVENVRFRGLTFQHSQYLLPAGGHSSTQAEDDIPAAIMADGARNVSFENCTVAHTGIYGIWFRRGCRADRVAHCRLIDLGAGGVRVGETEIRPNEADRTGQITIDNNILHGGGRIHAGAVGIWIGQSADNAVTHNDIGDYLYTGISVGWRWGYAESLAKRNLIAFNQVHHIGQGVLGDMGGIYTLGPSEGTVVRNNHFHDIYSFSNGAWGLYLDEGSTGIVMENNLVHDTTGGFHENYGKDDIVRNNILAFGAETQAHGPRDEGHHSLIFERNILYWNGGPKPHINPWGGGPGLSGNWTRGVTLGQNLFYDVARQSDAVNGLTPATSGEGPLSLVADPRFRNPAERDFRLPQDSPAYRIGFVPFDAAQAGVYGDLGWVRLAANDPMPARQIPPAPPEPEPLTITDGFEDVPVGAAPFEASVHTEGKGDSIVVTDETAATGKHSLKVVDAPGLLAAYNPHFYYAPHHGAGVTTCAFDLRIEAGVDLYQEWRDAASPYHVGPHFDIRDGRLIAAGRELMTLPVGSWVHFEVSAGLGAQTTGVWNLKVSAPGSAPQEVIGLPNGSPQWQSLEWLGFVSPATTHAVYYLDNFALRNDKQ